MKVAVVTDSTSDIPKEIAKKYGITIVPLNVHFDLDTYQDGINITSEEFYKKLVSGKIFPTTSAPSSGIFLETYKKLSENYDAIISIHVSSKTSATYNSALQASKEIKIPIEVIDSKVVSAALALIVIKIATYVKSSNNIKSIKSHAESLIQRTTIFFSLETLNFLIKGGRMGKAKGLIGSILKIKPILTFDDGEVNVYERIRSKRKAIEKIHELASSFAPYEDTAVIYSTDDTEPKKLGNLLQNFTKSKSVLSLQLGPVVGTYGGPNVIGFSGIKPDERDE
ncbi:MAG: fatty acid-binding protein DegV [Chloroflexi bacterium]|nr:fatty acid-binding protein DegV [Chloroflexota bacterium]|tara:strand:+ start:2581 stop:3426 length:846 start_codon:yes stop_codon:yes gene_type:complete